LLVVASVLAYVLFLGECCRAVPLLQQQQLVVVVSSHTHTHTPVCCTPKQTGVPVWWHTTSLHRPPLPHDAMQAAAWDAAAGESAFLPVTLQVVVVLSQGEGAQASSLQRAGVEGSAE
jgi:hypothetical protein